jgi:hypothetical protein
LNFLPSSSLYENKNTDDMQPSPRDLFGEIPVLESDLVKWVTAVAPRWLAPRRSFELYVKSYDVPAKVRRAKEQGTFYDMAD